MSSLPSIDDLALSDEAFAAALAKASVRLAGVALRAADGDTEQAKAMLRPVLQAIGALPYEAIPGTNDWGRRAT